MKGNEVCEWLTHNIGDKSEDNYMIFDRILKIYGDIEEFVKKENGSVSIYNNKGEEIINSRGGPYGFIVVVYNGFMSERKKKKIETNNPLKLVHYEDGRLTIIDEVSSWDMHLNSFGAMNASVFKKLIK